ncbi:glycosyltransferase family 2 protein [Methylobacter psychrophilus]|uniref:glycosyltransferase family 2 protein n=1 Tax=Methylobacter psychrophilus TaxID=96941 RepID=UPI0021D49A41|nr:glycosyltransferase family A protein [Methylobacter psychrophilus]
MTNKNNHCISVCILTYKRPAMLDRCLQELQNQQRGKFNFSIVVVDNDSNQSAKAIVDDWRKRSSVEIHYHVESEQNISLARNKAVANSSGDLIAFIDDDEFPENTWLNNLYLTWVSTTSDGVLGPVIPHFAIKPPQWLTKSGLLERTSFITGMVLKAEYTRTGNLLFDRKILDGDESPFDPQFGRSGGEDSDFFRRMIGKGHVFVWCNEANVYETVPLERFTRTYLIKRALLRGVSEARLRSIPRREVLKSLVACHLYTFALPFLLFLGHHLFMKYLIKDCDHIGKLLAKYGIEIIKERDF